MERKRQSNFELMRIILMITVPVYHLCVYNGIFYGEFNRNSYLGLALSSGGAIVADYAFMALSAYFLLNEADDPPKSVWKRFFRVFFQLAVFYVIKRITIECVFDYEPDNYIVNDFFLKGAWWFAYAYLVLLLVYPALNRFIHAVTIPRLRQCCLLLCLLLFAAGIINKSHILFDLSSFLCVYLYMGYLKRTDFRQMLFVKNRKSSQILFYQALYSFVFVTSCILRTPGVMEDEGLALSVIEILLGKYCILQFFMGIDVFLLFRNIRIPYARGINRAANSTFAVFLLHESVLAVFWYFGRCRTELPGLSAGVFLLWTGIYVIVCFLVGAAVQHLYNRICKPLQESIYQRISSVPMK